jgi:plastocyanin
METKVTRLRARARSVVPVLTALLLPGWTYAGSVGVDISGFAFKPANVNINVGDSVVWTQKDTTSHTSTSDTGLWDSKLLSINKTWTNTFTSAGTFPYHCTPHTFMKGSVTVSNAVVAMPPQLVGATWTSAGAFQFTINGTAGTTYLIQGSLDLTSWNTLQTLTATSSSLVVTDSPPARVTARFYRVQAQ